MVDVEKIKEIIDYAHGKSVEVHIHIYDGQTVPDNGDGNGNGGNGNGNGSYDKPFVDNPNEKVEKKYTMDMVVDDPDGETNVYLLVAEGGKDFAVPYEFGGRKYKLPNGTKVTVWVKNHPVDGGGELRKWWGVMAPDGRFLYFDQDKLSKV